MTVALPSDVEMDIGRFSDRPPVSPVDVASVVTRMNGPLEPSARPSLTFQRAAKRSVEGHGFLFANTLKCRGKISHKGRYTSVSGSGLAGLRTSFLHPLS